MPFPTVKTSPWKKPKARKPRGRFALWPAEFWRQLIDLAKESPNVRGLSSEIVEAIGDMNERLYGYR